MVGSDSALEIGMYIDFHVPGQINDYDVRLMGGYGWCECSGVMYATQFINSSDERLKENIEPINQSASVELITNINTYSFNYKNDNEKKKRFGVIAQEIKELAPELVNERKMNKDDDETYLGVDYIGLIPHLINTVKYQQSMIELMNKRIDELEKLIVNK